VKIISKKLRQFAAIAFLGFISSVAVAQDIEFKDLEGNSVKLSDYKGKWIIVNYWATWCPPCRVEMPELTLLHEQHKDKDAVVIGVNYESNPVPEVKKFIEEFMINFPVVREKNGADGYTTSFGPLKGLPTTYMVAPNGKVVAARTGMVDQKMLEAFMKKYEEKQKDKK